MLGRPRQWRSNRLVSMGRGAGARGCWPEHHLMACGHDGYVLVKIPQIPVQLDAATVGSP